MRSVLKRNSWNRFQISKSFLYLIGNVRFPAFCSWDIKFQYIFKGQAGITAVNYELNPFYNSFEPDWILKFEFWNVKFAARGGRWIWNFVQNEFRKELGSVIVAHDQEKAEIEDGKSAEIQILKETHRRELENAKYSELWTQYIVSCG